MNTIIGIAFFKIILYVLTAIWWGDLDAKIQDKAHREGQLQFGIGSDKVSRIWLRGLMIAALAFSTNATYTVMVFASLSLMWIPLFNTWLAYRRKYNDDTPELGTTGIDLFFLNHPTFYKVFKISAILIGLGFYVYAHVIIYNQIII